jgi:hypothetical protein
MGPGMVAVMEGVCDGEFINQAWLRNCRVVYHTQQ